MTPHFVSEVVSIAKSFQRSVRLEQDTQRELDDNGYILTPTARQTLTKVVDSLAISSTERSWTLTGPYGVGKSAFAVFLARLLCQGGSIGKQTFQQLRQVEPQLADKLSGYGFEPTSKRFLPVLLTARRVPAVKCLAEAFRDALTVLPRKKAGSLINQFSRFSSSIDLFDGSDSRNLSGLVTAALALARECGYAGVLLAIDELGKIFEYAARHPHRGDVFVLQELAELAGRSGEQRLLLIGLLHQSFEEYGHLLDSASRKEWQKVHGRFHDIAFLEPPDQVMRMVAAAIRGQNFPDVETLRGQLERISQEGVEAGLCPPGMSRKEFVDLAVRAYPLHPAAFVALPWLFRRFAQNERSLFSYLGNFEPCGFQEKIRALPFDGAEPQFVRLHDVFDYFANNFGQGVHRHPNARRWMEAADLLERGKINTLLEAALVKSIGALGALGEFSHLAASAATLAYAVTDHARVSPMLQRSLDGLQQRQLLIFRKFNQLYRLWEGSDFDIDEHLDAGRRQAEGRLQLEEVLVRYIRMRPLVARRHSFETGALRYFEVVYLDDPSKPIAPRGSSSNGADGQVIVCLARNEHDLDRFESLTQSSPHVERRDLIFAIPTEIADLRGAAVELAALRWVWEHNAALRDDRVARRELEQRIAEVERSLRRQLEGLLDPRRAPVGSNCRWFYRGIDHHVSSPAAVSLLVSTAADKLYAEAPHICNEMVNRRVLSSQGAGARRLLIELMLSHAGEENLGITGYPQERSFYESTLKATGMHRQALDGSWYIAEPDPAKETEFRMGAVWEKLRRLIFELEPEPRPLSEIFSILGAPPYGLLAGLHPILLCAFMIVYTDETTFYREGTFLPEPSLPDWEVLLRRPEMFAVAGCRVQGTRRAVVERLAKGLKTRPATVPVVRALVQNLKRLSEYAHRTQRLTAPSVQFRETMAQAKSPERLLFVEIPNALGLKPFEENSTVDDARIEDFFTRLNVCLRELAEALPKVINYARNQLLRECGFAEGAASWMQLVDAAEKMRPFCHSPQLLPLVQRLNEGASSEEGGVESVLALVANRPPTVWADHDIERFAEQARHYGGLFRELAGSTTTVAPYRAVLDTLTRHERNQSEDLVRKFTLKLNGFKAEARDPRILEAAFLLLAENVRSDYNPGKIHDNAPRD